MYASLSLCVVCVCGALRKKHRAFSDPRASNKRCQPSNRHRAIVRGVCCGRTRGVSGVCQGCALGVLRGEGGQVRAAYGVRGYGRRGCGGRLSDVCSQQKPQASGNTNRVCSGGAAAVSSHHPAAACTHWRGYAALDAHCGVGVRLCAAVCGCVRQGARVRRKGGRQKGEAEGREAQGGGQKGGRQEEGGRREGKAGGSRRRVRLQKPQHVSRQGESERFPLHSFRHRPEGGASRAGRRAGRKRKLP